MKRKKKAATASAGGQKKKPAKAPAGGQKKKPATAGGGYAAPVNPRKQKPCKVGGCPRQSRGVKFDFMCQRHHKEARGIKSNCVDWRMLLQKDESKPGRDTKEEKKAEAAKAKAEEKQRADREAQLRRDAAVADAVAQAVLEEEKEKGSVEREERERELTDKIQSLALELKVKDKLIAGAKISSKKTPKAGHGSRRSGRKVTPDRPKNRHSQRRHRAPHQHRVPEGFQVPPDWRYYSDDVRGEEAMYDGRMMYPTTSADDSIFEFSS